MHSDVSRNHNRPRNESDPDDRLCYRYGYDAQGRAISIDCYDDQEQHTILYDYYGDGQRKSVKVIRGTDTPYSVRYTYDNTGRLKDVFSQHSSASEVAVASYEYQGEESGNKPADRTKIITYKKGAGTEIGSRTYQMDALGRIQSITNAAGGVAVSSFTYTVRDGIDGMGRRRSVDEWVAPLGDQASNYHIDYGYDDLSRLKTVNLTTEGSFSLNRTYDCDNIGNRIDTSSWTYQSPGDDLKLPGAVGNPDEPVNSDILSSDGAYSYTFDDNGNLKERTGSADKTVYTYDLDNKLWKVEISQNQSGQWVLMQTVTYTYDPLGNLIRRASSGSSENRTTTYTIDLVRGLPVVLVESENGADVAKYTYGDDLLKVSRDGEYYYFYDGLGSTRVITDENGSVVARYAYDPYGAKLEGQCTGPNPDWNNFLFTGEFCDPATNLIYLRARWYDPGTGRFTSRDTYSAEDDDPATVNRYAYCAGDPANRTDPSGHEFTLTGVITTATNIMTLASYLSTGWDVYDFFRNPTVAGAVGLAVQFLPAEKILAGGVKAVRGGGKLVAQVAGRGASVIGPLRQMVQTLVDGYFGASRWDFILVRAAENYRDVFFTYTRLPEIYNGVKVIVHHAIPQRYVKRGVIPACLVHNLGNLRGVPEDVHKLINHEWIKFEELTRKELGRLPTADEVIAFAKYIDEEYASRYLRMVAE